MAVSKVTPVTPLKLPQVTPLKLPLRRRRPGFRPALKAAAVLVLAIMAAGSARAQFMGYVGFQTTPQTIFSGVACTGAAQTVDILNKGVSAHYLLYEASPAPASLSIFFEGRNATTMNWVRISRAVTLAASGFVYAQAYFNFIRVSVTCTVGSTITATYSGGNVPGDPSFIIPGSFPIPEFQVCNNRAVIDFTAAGAGSTRIITATGGGRSVYVCNILFGLSVPLNARLQYGTGANCGTGTTSLTGAFPNVTSVAFDGGPWAPIAAAVNTDVCINVSGAGDVDGVVVYAEF